MAGRDQDVSQHTHMKAKESRLVASLSTMSICAQGVALTFVVPEGVGSDERQCALYPAPRGRGSAHWS